MTLFKQFKPAIVFLVKFLAFYFIMNVLYTIWISSYAPVPDPATLWISNQIEGLLDLSTSQDVTLMVAHDRPSVDINLGTQNILMIYEGCNGINIAIVFIGFLLAFGPVSKRLLIFGTLGLCVIHAANLLRIVLLYFVTIHLPEFVYFTHKYLFTATIYLFVFAMWYYWIVIVNRKTRQA